MLEEIKVKYDLYRKEGQGVMQAYESVALDMDIEMKTVAAVIRRLKPSTQLAQDYIKASAMRLAVRVVREASAQQSIDLLSRPNIGVLAPMQTREAGGGGFFLSVSADSCGSVKVGVMPGPQQPLLEAANDGEQESTPRRISFGRGTERVREGRAAQLAAEARERLARKRKILDVGGFGGPDEGE